MSSTILLRWAIFSRESAASKMSLTDFSTRTYQDWRPSWLPAEPAMPRQTCRLHHQGQRPITSHQTAEKSAFCPTLPSPGGIMNSLLLDKAPEISGTCTRQSRCRSRGGPELLEGSYTVADYGHKPSRSHDSPSSAKSLKSIF